VKYSTFQKVMSEHNLSGLVFNSISKTVLNYSCRPNGGAEVKGTRYEFPAFVLEDNGGVTVTLHHVVWATSHEMRDLLWQPACSSYSNSWEEVLSVIDQHPAVLHRSRKSGMSLSRFIAALQRDGDYSAQISEATQACLRRLNRKGEELEVQWLTGDDLVNWYSAHDIESRSCMTGHHAEFVRVWSTNPAQARLAVFSDDKGQIARCLCFRPSASLEPLEDELPFGPGWAFSRMYIVQSAGRANNEGVERATVFCELKGLVAIGSKNCSGIVPLTMTEYAPFIDRGAILFQTRHVGRRVYYTTPGWNGRMDGWNETENNQWGSAWGRKMADENDEDCCSCACCEEQFYTEEMVYVQEYGSVCPSCMDDGEFHRCTDRYWRHRDYTARIVSETHSPYEDWVESGHDSVRVRCSPLGGGRSVDLTFVPAIIDADGEDGYVPEAEVLADGKGKKVWKKLVDNGTYKLVDKELNITHHGWMVTPCEPEYVLQFDRATIKYRTGATHDALLSSAFNWSERRLLNEEGTEVLVDHIGDYRCMNIKRSGVVLRFQRLGADTVLINDLAPSVVHTSNSLTYPAGFRVETIPSITLSSHMFRVHFNGVRYGEIHSLAYNTGVQATRWIGSMYSSGYAWGCYHSDSNLRYFLDTYAQHVLPEVKHGRQSLNVYIDKHGRFIDAAFVIQEWVFLMESGHIVGLFLPMSNKIYRFNVSIGVQSIDQMIAFSSSVMNTPLLSDIQIKYPGTDVDPSDVIAMEVAL